LKSFTRAELRMRAPHVKEASVHKYLTSLIKGGYVKTGPLVSGQSRGGGKVRRYDLVRDTGVDAPRLRKDGTEIPPTSQERMWLSMKIIGSFTAADLALSVSSEECPVPESTATSFLCHLKKAGYLAAAGNRGKEALYRLIRNTGGHPPVIQHTRVVYDPNLNRIMWHEEIEP
jgi:hypothetical protein